MFCESLPEADGATGVGASLVDELALELGDDSGLCIALAPPATNPIASRQADWALRGSVRRVHGELRTLVHLERTDDHEQVWSHGFQYPAQTGLPSPDLPRRIALDVARRLAACPARGVR